MSRCERCKKDIPEEEPSIKITKSGGSYHLRGGASSCYSLSLMDDMQAKKREKQHENQM